MCACEPCNCEELDKEDQQKIIMNRKYQTRGGRPIRILCIDRPDDGYPVVGITDTGGVRCYRPDGRATYNNSTAEDLVEVKERVTRYAAVFEGPGGVRRVSRYLSDTEADAYKQYANGRKVVDVIPVTIEY